MYWLSCRLIISFYLKKNSYFKNDCQTVALCCSLKNVTYTWCWYDIQKSLYRQTIINTKNAFKEINELNKHAKRLKIYIIHLFCKKRIKIKIIYLMMVPCACCQVFYASHKIAEDTILRENYLFLNTYLSCL